MPIPSEARAQAESALAKFCEEHSSAPGADPLRYTNQFETSAALLVEQAGTMRAYRGPVSRGYRVRPRTKPCVVAIFENSTS